MIADHYCNQRPFSHISDLHNLDLGSGHTAYRYVSLKSKNYWWTGGHIDTKTVFIRLVLAENSNNKFKPKFKVYK